MLILANIPKFHFSVPQRFSSQAAQWWNLLPSFVTDCLNKPFHQYACGCPWTVLQPIALILLIFCFVVLFHVFVVLFLSCYSVLVVCFV